MDRDDVLRRAHEAIEAWNQGDAEGFARQLAEDAVFTDVALAEPAVGRHAIRRVAEDYFTAFPDLRIEVTREIVDGATVVQEWTATGTHRGDVLDIPATGSRTHVRGCTVSVFGDDGLLRESNLYWTVHELLQQLGIVPVLARTPA